MKTDTDSSESHGDRHLGMYWEDWHYARYYK